MPHLSLEYTNNITQKIDTKTLFEQLHHVLETVGGVKIGHCKSRARVTQDFYIAEGRATDAFVHLDLRLLEGRSLELKRELGEQVLQVLNHHFMQTQGELDLQITVSIIDIERATYFKLPEGTL